MVNGTTRSRPLTVRQVAERLGLHPKTVERELRRKKLRGFKAAGRWRVSPEALLEYQAGGMLVDPSVS